MNFVYAPTRRNHRAIIGPVGCISTSRTDGRGPFGTITYDRPLSKNEIEKWELSTVDMPRVNYIVFGVRENGNRELLLRWEREMPGAFDAAQKRADEISEESVDYVVTPES